MYADDDLLIPSSTYWDSMDFHRISVRTTRDKEIIISVHIWALHLRTTEGTVPNFGMYIVVGLSIASNRLICIAQNCIGLLTAVHTYIYMRPCWWWYYTLEQSCALATLKTCVYICTLVIQNKIIIPRIVQDWIISNVMLLITTIN
jgi:hypothetical protein